MNCKLTRKRPAVSTVLNERDSLFTFQFTIYNLQFAIFNFFNSLPSAFCLLPSAFCLLPSAFCFLPSAFCFLPSASVEGEFKRSAPSSWGAEVSAFERTAEVVSERPIEHVLKAESD